MAHGGAGNSGTTTQAAPGGPPPSADAKFVIHEIDVGQGLAVLVEFSCGAVLVDTGGESNAKFESEPHLTAYLDAFFKRRSDLHETLAVMMISHNHVDHDRSASTILRRYHVLNVVTNGLTGSSGGRQQAGLIEEADAAHLGDDKINEHGIGQEGLHDAVVDPISCPDGDPDIRVFWGAVTPSDVDWGEGVLKNANNDSVVIKFTLGKASFLITGDLEIDGIDALLKKYAGTDVLDADAWQVGHHGSYNATTKALLDAITPKIALIGMGSPDRQETWSAWAYGHPRLSTIELLEAALTGDKREPVKVKAATGAKQFQELTLASPLYGTGWDGNIAVAMRADGQIDVKTRVEPSAPFSDAGHEASQ